MEAASTRGGRRAGSIPWACVLPNGLAVDNIKGRGQLRAPDSYRVDGGLRQWLGTCGASFRLPAPVVTVQIGQDIDVHMTQTGPGASGTEYPLPTTTNSQVLARTSITDGNSTASFQARSPGLAQLETVGGCPSESSSSGCPILSVIVIG